MTSSWNLTLADGIQRPDNDADQVAWQRYAEALPAIGESWIKACKRPGNPLLLKDTLGNEYPAKKALTASRILATHIDRLSPEQNIGIMLPTTAAGMLVNMATWMLGKTTVNLNYTASEDTIRSAIEQSTLKTVYTSERFISALKERGLDINAVAPGVQIVALETLAGKTSALKKLGTLMQVSLLSAPLLAGRWCRQTDPEAIASIVFSSGSEGAPKGVMLSHRNLQVNVRQVNALLNLENDIILANLPLFHSFGLTAAMLLPLLSGLEVICHPDPTDVFNSANAISKHNVSLLFGTSSFYRLYTRNKKVHPEMLDSLRLVIAGAEKMQDQIRNEFQDKFGKEILEGYGATETAPVASVNVPDFEYDSQKPATPGNRTGTVGKPLPGTRFLIVDPDTYSPLPQGEAGMVLISGPQVMQGYLNDEEKNTHSLKSVDGCVWYVSGDKGSVDADGFLTIEDRYSRFAKIGGEMVSLGMLEMAVKQLLTDPELDLVAVNLPDDRKGEKIIMLINQNVDPKQMRDDLIAQGLNPLALPVSWFTVDTIPTLGSGKKDFATAKTLAQSLI